MLCVCMGPKASPDHPYIKSLSTLLRHIEYKKGMSHVKIMVFSLRRWKKTWFG